MGVWASNHISAIIFIGASAASLCVAIGIVILFEKVIYKKNAK